MTSSQSWEAWKGVDEELNVAVTPNERGSVAVQAEVTASQPMDELHPLYGEWDELVDLRHND